MSLRANIEHLGSAQGIEAVAVMNPAGPREFRGEERWSPVLDGAIALLQKTDGRGCTAHRARDREVVATHDPSDVAQSARTTGPAATTRCCPIGATVDTTAGTGCGEAR